MEEYYNVFQHYHDPDDYLMDSYEGTFSSYDEAKTFCENFTLLFDKCVAFTVQKMVLGNVRNNPNDHIVVRKGPDWNQNHIDRYWFI